MKDLAQQLSSGEITECVCSHELAVMPRRLERRYPSSTLGGSIRAIALTNTSMVVKNVDVYTDLVNGRTKLATNGIVPNTSYKWL